MVAARPHPRLRYRNTGPLALAGRTIYVLDERPPLTAEDLRIHAWINQRLAVLHRERYGLWARLSRHLP